MSGKRTGRKFGRWFVAALAAFTVLTAGCSVDPDELPGVYRNDATGGEIRLDANGTFSATDVLTDGHSGPADFKGRWEFLDDQASSDFIYLTIVDGGLGGIAGIQLWPAGRGKVEFKAPDEPRPFMVLTKVAAR
jgi:hypothetical protein